jgi:predicted metal-dependent enzyme (double-stranded beta helix superfamily)
MKLLYKPFGLIVGVIGGILAGVVFKQVWKLVAHEDDAPDSTDVQKSWTEVLIAATLQGAIFALVKAAVDRGAAEATLKLTGIWPGSDSAAEAEKEAEKERAKQEKKAKKAEAAA